MGHLSLEARSRQLLSGYVWLSQRHIFILMVMSFWTTTMTSQSHAGPKRPRIGSPEATIFQGSELDPIF